MPVHRTCQRCARAFVVSPSAIAAGRGRFCSRPCWNGTPEQRFYAKVDTSPDHGGCWRWMGSPVSRSQPYGRIQWEGRLRLAHHVSYLLHVGSIPEDKLVLHGCPGGGNPWCVNPEHLRLGTHADNYQDIVANGRHWTQTGSWSPKRRPRPEGVVGDTRELRLILQRTIYRRLAAQAKAEGVSLEEYATRVLAARE